MIEFPWSIGAESLLLLAALALVPSTYAWFHRHARRRKVQRRLRDLRPLIEPWLTAHR